MQVNQRIYSLPIVDTKMSLPCHLCFNMLVHSNHLRNLLQEKPNAFSQWQTEFWLKCSCFDVFLCLACRSFSDQLKTSSLEPLLLFFKVFAGFCWMNFRCCHKIHLTANNVCF